VDAVVRADDASVLVYDRACTDPVRQLLLDEPAAAFDPSPSLSVRIVAGVCAVLLLFFLVPALGKTAEENEKEFYDILEKFKTEKVDDETLARVKTKARAGLIRQLDSNAGLASQLTTYHVAYGDWRKLFTALDEINKVTAEDVQRVARKYFVPEARTVALTVQPKKKGGAQ
jgi:hypothetical protein